jgi:hypothetical protein
MAFRTGSPRFHRMSCVAGKATEPFVHTAGSSIVARAGLSSAPGAVS